MAETTTTGSGLGKDETGIKDAIKVKIKHDTAGVGHNKGDEFTFQWWDHVFNKAASSISVKSSEDGVAVEKIAENGPISNKKTKTYDSKAMLYGQFVKGATLSNGAEDHVNEDDDSSSEEDEEKIRLNRLMEDSMLAFCDGMTGHKAARHGHRLSGKMARVMEQEKQQLEKMKQSKDNQDRKRSSEDTESVIESEGRKRKKKKKNKGDNKDNCDDNLCDETINMEDVSSKKAKKKRKQNDDENLLIDSYHEAVSCDHVSISCDSIELQVDSVCTDNTSSSDKRKKKSKKKKRKKEQWEESDETVMDKSKK